MQNLLLTLHQRGHLLPLLRRAVVDLACANAARDQGLTVSDEELQRAADRERRSRGYITSQATHEWLKNQGLTVLDFEETLERDLLSAKLKDQLLAARGAAHFEAAPSRYDRVQVRILVLASEGEAREILARITDEGADFASLARRHSLHLESRAAGGSLGGLFRCQLPAEFSELLFTSPRGKVVGPFSGPGGYSLIQVEETTAAQLDQPTRAWIRAELYDTWVRHHVNEIHFEMSWLKNGASCSG